MSNDTKIQELQKVKNFLLEIREKASSDKLIDEYVNSKLINNSMFELYMQLNKAVREGINIVVENEAKRINNELKYLYKEILNSNEDL